MTLPLDSSFYVDTIILLNHAKHKRLHTLRPAISKRTASMRGCGPLNAQWRLRQFQPPFLSATYPKVRAE
jgi:hypothetical protein